MDAVPVLGLAETGGQVAGFLDLEGHGGGWNVKADDGGCGGE